MAGTAEEVGGMQPTMLSGTAETIAAALLEFRELGFDEIRCDVRPKTPDGIEALGGVVDGVHASV
ncbi:MAG: hypothetical protein QF921_05285 [Pseudomonadales bacterium]|jgi:hypothetical protein|nr:hypothetical protein [Pseudomonadales bacterium]MDP6471923.1 hypothetical protein [Pseudomonadales bacterium]MDP6826807.1 hypothetical protein [Pseudomonadales bacterium]MDP6970915.1 hypothetical protein [Pseudomonadales bacterium]|tara:strand:- start:1478 stop:1672 length:195 start_codon:yes stop_codon:yes gene_type:complete